MKLPQKSDPQSINSRLDRLHAEARHWCVRWGCSRLIRDVQIEFSEDPGSALGTLNVRSMRIILNGVLLLEQNESLLHETLCHELAHAIAAIRYGTGIREHGVEWCDYMEKAGFSPRPVIAAGEIHGLCGIL